ncbi:MAG: TIGR04442 family protein [Blastocatellia bacterium]|nr:TIGR04442 family protein [Blastocatellia bacterium]
MIRDVHIGGHITERHEYFATVIGPNLNIRLLYDGRVESGRSYDRFFSGGSEILLTENGVGHTGTGGTFCSYMFGVEIPQKDLLRRDVRNRLVMHGARYHEEADRLAFSNDTAGFEAYSRIFNTGHAFINYYFFLTGDLPPNVRTAQETILRVAGKFLKRHDVRAASRDGRDLAHALHEACGNPNWTLFLVKIIDAHAEAYHARFTSAYASTRNIGDDEQRTFDLLARHYRLDPYQQERIHLDVIYEQEDNKRIIDAYKDALTAHLAGRLPQFALLPKLNLLRAFATRNRIPRTLLDLLDALLMTGDRSTKPVDPPFVADARRILDRLFVDCVGGDLEIDDLIKLMQAKREASDQRFVGFESVLLDAALASDEWSRAGKSGKLRLQFEQIVNYFDLFDDAATLVNSIGFTDDFELSPNRLEEMLESRQAFEELQPGLFEELFIAPLERNQYLSMHGRRRIELLRRGLRTSDGDPGSARSIPDTLREANAVARRHRIIDGMLKRFVGNIHEEPLTEVEKEALRVDVENRLRSEFGIATTVDQNLLDSVLLGIEEEFFYTQKLLPEIIAKRDLVLRENFLRSSGLDLFRIEELEAAYLRSLEQPPDVSAQSQPA